MQTDARRLPIVLPFGDEIETGFHVDIGRRKRQIRRDAHSVQEIPVLPGDLRWVGRQLEHAEATLLVREPNELRAEQIARIVCPHREVIEDALAALGTRRRHIIKDALGRASREILIVVTIEHGPDNVMVQRFRQRINARPVLDQAFDHPVIAGRIDIDDADMAELTVDVTDAGDSGAVVRHAANEDDIAGAEIPRGAVPVERVVHQRVVIGPREAAEQIAAFADARMPGDDLAEHVRDVAENPKDIAKPPASPRAS